MKKPSSKLSLTRETIRTIVNKLEESQLREVGGGTGGGCYQVTANCSSQCIYYTKPLGGCP